MKVIVVDDEISVHEQLEKRILWSSMNLQLIGHAYDVKEAINLINSINPEIVITDIRMPSETGLDLMQYLKLRNFEGKVIVLSGYNDFEYSRSAFLFNAFDYLLKPLRETELLIVLNKAIEEINKEKNLRNMKIDDSILNKGLTLMKDNFFYEVIKKIDIDENEFIIKADELNIEVPEYKYCILILKFIESEELYDVDNFEKENNIYSVIRSKLQNILQENECSIFRNPKIKSEFSILFPLYMREKIHKAIEMANEMSKVIISEMYSKITMLVGVSSIKNQLTNIYLAYQEAHEAIKDITLIEDFKIKEFNTINHINSIDIKEWNNVKNKFMCFSEIEGLDGINEVIGELERFRNEKIISNSKLSLLEENLAFIIYSIEFISYQMNDNIKNKIRIKDLINKSKAYLNEFQVFYCMRSILEVLKILKSCSYKEGNDRSSKELIENIKEYIKNNYKTASLTEVSEKFFINKNYFCSLFKSITGENFSNYLTKVRMDKAKFLLINSNLKIYEIAKIVGYDDQRYFSQVFKKVIGIKPTDIREKINE